MKKRRNKGVKEKKTKKREVDQIRILVMEGKAKCLSVAVGGGLVGIEGWHQSVTVIR